MYEHNTEDVTAGWRKMHNEELHRIFLCDHIKKDNMSGTCSPHLG